MSNGVLPSLNGLRAVSIILVMFHHLSEKNYLLRFNAPALLTPFADFFQDGHLGVNIFFVISGFLITFLLLAEEEKTGSISLRNFFVRRVIRIFPAYYFLLLVYFLLQVSGKIQITANSWFSAITYTKYLNWQRDWYTSHAWSLSVEEHFYLFWPFLFLYARKLRKLAALSLFLIVPFIRVFLYYHPVEHLNDLTIFTRIDGIAIGCLCALYKGEIMIVRTRLAVFLVWTSFVGLFLLRYLPLLTDRMNLSFIWIPLGLTHGTIGNIFIATIMMYSIFGPTNRWYTLLNSKFFNYLGVLSYSIYLWQQVFLANTGSFFTSIPTNLAGICIMALFSYYVVEKPFLKLKAKFQAQNVGQ
jgi:peptidoglycan/LPS O-acetylase OafA/YrhL